MGTHFVDNVRLVSVECCVCHTIFAMTEDLNKQCLRKMENKTFYCPNGHEQHYVGLSEEEKLRRSLKSVQACCTEYEGRVEELEKRIPRMIGGYRAQLKRSKSKVSNE